MEDEATEFDSSSDEESCADEALVEEESDLGNLGIARDVDFLMGTSKTKACALFCKSHCASCSPWPVYVILCHVTGSCKGRILAVRDIKLRTSLSRNIYLSRDF